MLFKIRGKIKSNAFQVAVKDKVKLLSRAALLHK